MIFFLLILQRGSTKKREILKVQWVQKRPEGGRSEAADKPLLVSQRKRLTGFKVLIGL